MADLLRKSKSLYSSTSNTFGTGEGETITPASVVGLPTDTEIVLTFDRVDSSGTATPTKMERIKGTISGGNLVVASGGRGYDGSTEQAHTSPVVEMVFNAKDWNDVIDAYLVGHDQAGAHAATIVSTAGTQTLTNKTLTSPVINTGISGTAIVDEDNMASDSATKVPTQQSVKAYADGLGTATGWMAAGETWTYASADDPTFTFTITGDKTSKYSVGMKLKLTQTTAKYFIITKIAYSDPNTTVTVYGGTEYDLASATITSPFYSPHKAPQGFPLETAKWTATTSDTSDRAQASPADGTYYNVGTLNLAVPIGSWRLMAKGAVRGAKANSTYYLYVALSTANNSVSDSALQWKILQLTTSAEVILPFIMEKSIDVTSKTPYYLIIAAGTGTLDAINIRGNWQTTVIEAVCAYL